MMTHQDISITTPVKIPILIFADVLALGKDSHFQRQQGVDDFYKKKS